MKLFVDRNRTLLPRIDRIYLVTRLLVLGSLFWFAFSNRHISLTDYRYLMVIGTYAAHALFFYLTIRGTFDIKLAYLSSIIYDLILIPLLIVNSGGADTAFSLLYFITISVAAYVLTVWFSLAIVLLISAVYVMISVSFFSVEFGFDLTMRLLFFWVDYLVVLYASEYIRKSEHRLLKLLNTLNMRTSELEKSQVHLEMIYENTRILASILDTDSLVNEVMRLMGNLMHYEAFAIVFKDKQDNYYYRARFTGTQRNYHLQAIDMRRMALVKKVAEMKESIIVNDISSRDDYLPLNKNSKSIMLSPMAAHGRTNGFLIAESTDSNRFKDKDQQMLTAISHSAALALENAELHKRTEELTVIDGLTETYNYRYFMQKLQEEKRRALRYNLPLSLIMVDIDYFKKLNDTYGHETGNMVLHQLSGVIKQCIRDVDIFSRYGGEEFAIILPQTPQQEAHVIGERIRDRVEQTIFNGTDNHKIRITVSVGLSSFPENGRSQEELVSVADKALYKAKGDGRNQVCIS